ARHLIGSDDLRADARQRLVANVLRCRARQKATVAMAPWVGERGLDGVQAIEPEPAAVAPRPCHRVLSRHGDQFRARAGRERQADEGARRLLDTLLVLGRYPPACGPMVADFRQWGNVPSGKGGGL